MKSSADQKLTLLKWIDQVTFHHFRLMKPSWIKVYRKSISIPKQLLGLSLAKGRISRIPNLKGDEEKKREPGFHGLVTHVKNFIQKGLVTKVSFPLLKLMPEVDF